MLYIFPDVETSGMKTPTARVIEVAAVVLNEKYEEIDSFSSLANPGFDAMVEADPEAMATNGISIDEVAAAPPTQEVAQAFEAFLDKHWGGLLFAFNKDFDSWFLEKSPWNVSLQKWGECVMLASMDVMAKAGKAELRKGGSPKWPSLSKAAAFFNVPQDGAHRALVDARTAAMVYAKILSKRDELRYMKESANESIQILEQGY
jgi:DNA polymerase III epsilon subunit-like protein